MIYGNIDGVKNSILNKLENACDIRVSKDCILSEELVDILVRGNTRFKKRSQCGN